MNEDLKEIFEINSAPQSIPDNQSWLGGEIGLILIAALSMVAKYFLLKSSKWEDNEKEKQIIKLKTENAAKEQEILQLKCQIKILQRAMDLSGDFAPPVTKERVNQLNESNQ